MTANTLRTFFLLAGLTALFMGIGYLLGGTGGALIALVVAAGMNVFAWWNSADMVLRMHGAREIGPDERLPQLRQYALDVQDLARRAGRGAPGGGATAADDLAGRPGRVPG